MGYITPLYRGLQLPLEGRLATATLEESSRSVEVSRGWPQGGVLSPPLGCLDVDELIASLNGCGVYTQGYADDMSSNGGKIPKYDIKAYTMGPSYYRDLV
jgi:hypothetical protein